MKRSRKVTVGIILFFVVVISVISARTAMGVYFKKKFGTRPPPGVIVEVVTEKQFSQTMQNKLANNKKAKTFCRTILAKQVIQKMPDKLANKN